MNNHDYEKARQECWDALRKELLDGEVQWQPVSRKEIVNFAFDRAYALGKQEIKQEIKQEKDAEGEEMLCVKAKTVREMYAANDRLIADHAGDEIEHDSATINDMLRNLFGSKCLPDEHKECSNPSVVNCKHKHGDGTCSLDNKCCHKSQKPAGPKFKVEDEVVWDKRIIAYVDEILNDGDYIIYSRVGNRYTVHESDLEPYTEPTETFTDDRQSQCKSQNHPNRDLCDKLMRRGFRDHNRLNIATRMATAILGNPDEVYRAKTCGKGEQIPQNIAEYAVAIADALISEAERKGGKQ